MPPQSRYKRNVTANLIGRAVTAALGLAVVPVVVRIIGIEAYGLVGFFATLQALFGLLDLGLTATMTREMARRSASPADAKTCRDFVRTIETIYWAVGLLITTMVIAAAPAIAHHWIKVRTISTATAQSAVILMGITLAAQWPLSIYDGGIVGLQRQVLGTFINVTATILRTGGALLVIVAISPTIEAYLLTQCAGYAVQTLATAIALWRLLPAADHPARFRPDILREVRRFAVGITATAIVSVALTQLDKIVVSRLLDLKSFGYYSIGATAAAGLYYIATPIFTAIYPELTQRAYRFEQELQFFYHRASQLMAVAILPIAATIAFFSREVLFLWIRDLHTASVASTVLTILVTGTAIHALMHIPYALQLAYGWTTLALWMNACSLAVLAPLMYMAAHRWGAVGAAAVWLLLNVGYIIVIIPVMHRRLLPAEMSPWYRRDALLPAVTAIGTVALWRLVLPMPSTTLPLAAFVGGCALTAYLLTALVTPAGREILAATVSWLRRSDAVTPATTVQ